MAIFNSHVELGKQQTSDFIHEHWDSLVTVQIESTRIHQQYIGM